MKVTDLSGFGSIGREIVRATSAAIGRIYTPTAIRNQADAKAYEIEKLAIAKAKASLVLDVGRENIARRAAERIYITAVNEQPNLEAVVDTALALTHNKPENYDADNLDGTSDEQPAPVSPDWMARFIDCARFASEDDVRSILGHILKEQAGNNNSVSMRLLECVKSLTPADIRLFGQFRWVLREFGSPVAYQDDLFGVLTCFEFLDNISQDLIDTGLVQYKARMGIAAKANREFGLEFGGSRFLIANEQDAVGYIYFLDYTKIGYDLDRILGENFIVAPDKADKKKARREFPARIKRFVEYAGMRVVKVVKGPDARRD